MTSKASNTEDVRSTASSRQAMVSSTVIAAAQRGDQSALRRIYEASAPALFRLTRRIVGPNEAEDVLQQTFVKVLTTIHQFNGESSFETWLYRVTVNEALQHLRRRGRWHAVSLVIDPMDGRPHHERARDEADLLEQALARLDPELRCLFVLREVERLSYRELAQALNIAEGTVASRLSRARQLLKTHLEDLGWEA